LTGFYSFEMSLLSPRTYGSVTTKSNPHLANQAGMSSLGPKTDWVADKLKWVENTRGRQMIVEDVMGFAFLRTLLDLMRGFVNGSGAFNIPAGTERLIREGASIFTDNILGGITAKFIGNRFFDKKGTAFSNGFTNYETLETFEKILKHPNVKSDQDFVRGLAEHIAPGNKNFAKGLSFVWDHGTQSKSIDPSYSVLLAQTLHKTDFDLPHNLKLPDLLEDLRLFKAHLSERLGSGKTQGFGNNPGWTSVAANSVKNTLQAKNWKLSALGLGLFATAMVPLLNVKLTKALYKINIYPGEIGLGDNQNPQALEEVSGLPQKKKSNWSFKNLAKHFPYVSKEADQGNIVPLAFALTPLVFAAGLFDTVNRRWINVLAKDGLKQLRNAFDFQKGWPYTSQQQMSSMFAMLITSRLLCARSDNEYRERFIDSFAGWGLWIFGTPIIKIAFSKLLDKGLMPGISETCLLTPPGKDKPRIRSNQELDLLAKSLSQAAKTGDLLWVDGKKITSEMIQRSRKANIWLSAISMGTTIVGLGIIEPLVGMLWTKRHEQNKQAFKTATQVMPPFPFDSN
jgi:hypothetical protein